MAAKHTVVMVDRHASYIGETDHQLTITVRPLSEHHTDQVIVEAPDWGGSSKALALVVSQCIASGLVIDSPTAAIMSYGEDPDTPTTVRYINDEGRVWHELAGTDINPRTNGKSD